MIDIETLNKKRSALRTLLEIMEVPEFRRDTTRLHNIRWLHRNLGIDHGSHPMFETANNLIVWILRNHGKVEVPDAG